MKTKTYLDGVYELLRTGTESVNRKKAEVKRLQERIDSGLYVIEIQKKDIAQRDELSNQIQKLIPTTIDAVKNLIGDEVARLQEEDSPRGADLTDDARLLSSGMRLRYNDIMNLWNKPENQNATMKRLIAEYTENHKILQPNSDQPLRLHYKGNAELIQQMQRNTDSITHYYSRWMDKDNNLDMLDKFMPEQAAYARGEDAGE